jgi:hypothetical protein
MNNTVSKIILISFLNMSFVASLKSQAVMMNCVGLMNGTSSSATVINFKSNKNCIDVQSGIAVFSGVRNFGNFDINCEVTQLFNSLGIQLYPNPVRGITKVKFVNTPPFNEVFSISIWNTEGIMLSSRKETGYQIFQGIMLDVSHLSSGSYVLKIESIKYGDALKFIKIN